MSASGDHLARLKQAALALQKANRRIAELEAQAAARDDVIAVVGLSCRFPGGVNSAADCWQLLADGVDATGEIPARRWPVDAGFDPDPTVKGKMRARRGAFVEDIEYFDADFFAMSRREALKTDPQHRMLLEVAWAALEDAGVAPDSLRNTTAGTFLGITISDYSFVLNRCGLEAVDAYDMTGGCLNFAAGRLAYTLGIHGPAMAVDSACSSSLVSAHLACQSLKAGECDVALACGVNAILSPEMFVAVTKAGMISGDGRCKTFDQQADGFGRGEGCGVVVLKRLADAQRDGDQVRAIIRGSAVGQDGDSSGLTVPNRHAQEAVIEAALRAAGLGPDDIDMLEAHGTGTALGDPIELRALANVFGRRQRPLVVGSIKTNMGHMESAAGIGGLIKCVLSVEQGQVPPHLNFSQPTDAFDWQSHPLTVPTSLQAWPQDQAPRRAGLSSFGGSGTLAHMVIEQAPAVNAELAPATPAERSHPQLMVLSAATPSALDGQRQQLAAWLRRHPSALSDQCRTSRLGRNHMPCRTFAISDRHSGMVDQLDQMDPARLASKATGQPPRVAFLISGSSTRLRSGALALLAQEPGFEQLLTASTDSLTSAAGRSLSELLSDSQLAPTVAEPLAVAIGASLCRLWQTWGIEPVAVLGTGSGELVAASACGALDLAGAMLLAQVEGQIKDRVKDQKQDQPLDQPLERLALSLPMNELEPLLSRHPSVRLVADNGAAGTVVQGPTGAVSTLTEALAAIPEVRCQPLTAAPEIDGPVDWPALTGGRPELAMLSTVTGQELEGETLTQGSHWQGHLTGAVQLGPALGALPGLGVDTVLEIGFDGQLLALSRLASGQHASWLSAAGDDGAGYGLLRQLGQLYALGAEINWSAYDRDRPGRKVSLPTYPFERSRYWVDAPPPGAPRHPSAGHPLLGQRADSPLAHAHYQQQISAPLPAQLGDHVICERVLLPAAGMLEMALAAQVSNRGYPAVLEAFEVLSPCQLGTEPMTLSTVQQGSQLKLYSTISDPAGQGGQGGGWRLHATAMLGQSGPSVDLAPPDSADHQSMDLARCYQQFADLGARFGAGFQRLTQLRCSPDHRQISATIEPVGADHRDLGYQVFPPVLDACIQTFGAALLRSESPSLLLPISAQKITLYQNAMTGAQCRARITAQDADTLVGDFVLESGNGELLLAAEQLRCQRATAAQLERSLVQGLAADASGSVQGQPGWYTTTWQAAALDAAAGPLSPGRWQLRVAEPGLASEMQTLWSTVAQLPPDQVTTCQPSAWHDPEVSANVVFQAGMPGSEDDPAAWALAELAALAAAVNGVPEGGTLVLLTQSAQQVFASEDVQPGHTQLCRFLRSARLERPEITLVALDIESAGQPLDHNLRETLTKVCQELTAGTESEVAIRAGVRHVARFGPAATEPVTASTLVPGQRTGPGGMQEVAQEMPRPGPGEVVIEVRYTGLNFRDVLNVMDMYPDAPDVLGCDVAGRIAAVGNQVSNWRPGDPVLCPTQQGFSTWVTVSAELPVALPAALDFAHASALPIAWLTAWYCLVDAAGLKAGERVLIHAAAGGVGQAAVAIAHQLGATVVATASSEAKRSLLEARGVAEIYNSRSLDFADALSGDRRVDVVLNSLAGDFIGASVDCLKPRGRFMEIGKRDVWSPEKMQATRPDVAYRVIWLGDVTEKDPATARGWLQDIVAGLAAGDLQPMTVSRYAFEQAGAAFTRMSRGEHVGKLVVSQPVISRPVSIRSDGVYLITGGTGFLGLAAAQWLAEQGAKQVILASRTAAQSPQVEALRQAGVQVDLLALDVGDAQTLATRLAKALAAMPAGQRKAQGDAEDSGNPGARLRGVIHAAGIAADQLLAQQSAESASAVYKAKVDGALGLLQAMESLGGGQGLDFLAFFGAGAAELGSPGQAVYAAANAYLAGLTQSLRLKGINACCLSPGPVAGGGMVAAVGERHQQRWVDSGFATLTDAEVMAALSEMLLDGGIANGSLLNMDWERFRQARSGPGGTLFEWLGSADQGAGGGSPRGGTQSLVHQIRKARPREARAMLQAAVSAQVARVLAMETGVSPPLKEGFQDLGMDSMMAVELRTAIADELDMRLPATVVFDYPTVDELSGHLMSRLAPDHSAAPTKVGQNEHMGREMDSNSERNTDVSQLSEQEAEAALNAELEGLMQDTDGGQQP